MALRFLTILTGRNLPKIRQSRGFEPSTINEKTIADVTRLVEQTRILERVPSPCGSGAAVVAKARASSVAVERGRELAS